MSAQDFKMIKTESKGHWWEHTPTKTAKFFRIERTEHHSPEWSEDRWGGRTGGGVQTTVRAWTESEVAENYHRYAEDWRPYDIVYNPAFRKNEIKLKP